MKLFLLSLSFFFVGSVVKAQAAASDSNSNFIAGWVVFREDEGIWVPADVDKAINTKEFFKTVQYVDGVLITGYQYFQALKSVAKTYSVFFRDSRTYGTIQLIAVTVRRSNSILQQGNEVLGWGFKYRNWESSVIYTRLPGYRIDSIIPVRKKDFKKYKLRKRSFPTIVRPL